MVVVMGGNPKMGTRTTPMSILIKLFLLVIVLLICVANICFMFWQTSRHSSGGAFVRSEVDSTPFILVPTTEGFTNNYLNINDAWMKFTRARGRSVSILRSKVPHYDDTAGFCVGDYLQLPKGIACSTSLADDFLQDSSKFCNYPRGFYREISWFVLLAESWFSEAWALLPEGATVDSLAGVRVTENLTWDYAHEGCGLYRFTDYSFSEATAFPIIWQPHIAAQHAALLAVLVSLNELFAAPFVVVHWRRGDEVSRYTEGDVLPLNCRDEEALTGALEQWQRDLALPRSVYISTNEQNQTRLAFLEARGHFTSRALLAALAPRSAPGQVELFLFELQLMSSAGMFVYFGSSKVPLLAGRLMHQRGLTYATRSLPLQSAGGGVEHARAFVKSGFLESFALAGPT